jgi:hypothetical protein
MRVIGRKRGKSSKKENVHSREQTTSLSPISPHPYHLSPPSVPRPSDLEERRTAGHSRFSDVTIHPFSDRSASALEYSDTSDEYAREDRYFSQPISELNSGESAFRTLQHSTRNSHKVVHYSSSSLEFPFEDKSEENPELLPLLPSTLPEIVPPPPSTRTPMAQPKRNDKESWMASLAYSFRSPASVGIADRKRDESEETPIMNKRTHRSQQSSSTIEFPYTLPYRKGSHSLEQSPLLPLGSSSGGSGVYGASSNPHPFVNGHGKANGEHRGKHLKSRRMAATISAFYLMDYEAGRPPTLTPNFEAITQQQLRIFRIEFSWAWRWFGVNLAVVILFVAHAHNYLPTVVMHTYALIIFLSEIWMKEVLYGSDHSKNRNHPDRAMVQPLIIFLFALGFESWAILYFFPEHLEKSNNRPFLAITSIFKPIIFFYISRKARHALEALLRISRIVIRVLMIEMFMILSFAAVACRMYKGYDSFQTLSMSWLSLFEREYYNLFHGRNTSAVFSKMLLSRPCRFSFYNCGKSKPLDAHVPIESEQLYFFCFFSRDLRILFAFFGSVRCLSNIYTSCY